MVSSGYILYGIQPFFALPKNNQIDNKLQYKITKVRPNINFISFVLPKATDCVIVKSCKGHI